jgi:hypothetical protein
MSLTSTVFPIRPIIYACGSSASQPPDPWYEHDPIVSDERQYNVVYNVIIIKNQIRRKEKMAKTKKSMTKAEDMDKILDQMGIAKGAARDKAKTYCIAKLNSSEGKCLPSDELSLIVRSYFDGYSESLRGG